MNLLPRIKKIEKERDVKVRLTYNFKDDVVSITVQKDDLKVMEHFSMDVAQSIIFDVDSYAIAVITALTEQLLFVYALSKVRWEPNYD